MLCAWKNLCMRKVIASRYVLWPLMSHSGFHHRYKLFLCGCGVHGIHFISTSFLRHPIFCLFLLDVLRGIGQLLLGFLWYARWCGLSIPANLFNCTVLIYLYITCSARHCCSSSGTLSCRHTICSYVVHEYSHCCPWHRYPRWHGPLQGRSQQGWWASVRPTLYGYNRERSKWTVN